MKITAEEFREIEGNLRGHLGCIRCRKLQKDKEKGCPLCLRPYISATEFRRLVHEGSILVMASTGIMRGLSKLDCND